MSDNLRRTLSGLALGIPFPFLLFPLLNCVLYPGRDRSYPLSKVRDWAWLGVLFALAASAILLSESVGPIFYAVSSIGVAGVFLFFSSVFLLVLVLGFEKWQAKPFHRAALAILIASVFLVVSAFIHDLLLDSI